MKGGDNMIPKEMKEHWNKHKKYMGYAPLIIGALILINVYFLKLTWIAFFGWFLFLIGLCKIIMHKYFYKKK